MFKFESFNAWVRAINFADEILRVSEGIRQRYQFSLGEQLRRASISVPANIAEGAGRDGANEKANFYNIAKGSLYEVVCLIEIAKRRSLLSDEDYQRFRAEADQLSAILTASMRTIRLGNK